MLIIDDEDTILFAMGRFFRARGFEVDVAHELEEAQALLANVRYSVVIADLRLTGVHGAEGLEIIAYVREHCPWTRTLLLTAYGSLELEEEALERGVDAMMRKPQSLADIASTVARLLEAGP